MRFKCGRPSAEDKHPYMYRRVRCQCTSDHVAPCPRSDVGRTELGDMTPLDYTATDLNSALNCSFQQPRRALAIPARPTLPATSAVSAEPAAGSTLVMTASVGRMGHVAARGGEIYRAAGGPVGRRDWIADGGRRPGSQEASLPVERRSWRMPTPCRAGRPAEMCPIKRCRVAIPVIRS